MGSHSQALRHLRLGHATRLMAVLLGLYSRYKRKRGLPTYTWERFMLAGSMAFILLSAVMLGIVLGERVI